MLPLKLNENSTWIPNHSFKNCQSYYDLREVYLSSWVERCLPDEGGLLLVLTIGMCDWAAFIESLGVWGVGKRSNPLVVGWIAGLYEEALEWHVSFDCDWKKNKKPILIFIRPWKYHLIQQNYYSSGWHIASFISMQIRGIQQSNSLQLILIVDEKCKINQAITRHIYWLSTSCAVAIAQGQSRVWWIKRCWEK